MNECPACGGRHTVDGRCFDPIGGIMGQVFHPGEIRFLSLGITTLNVQGGNRFTACLDCGHLWSSVNPKKLTKIMRKHGRKKARARLQLND